MPGKRKRIRYLLPAAKGKFLNVVSLMNRKNKLFFEVLESTFNTDKLIRFMDNFAAQTIKRTVVILDNSPIHRSNEIHGQNSRSGEIWMFIFIFLTSLFSRIEFDRNIVAQDQISMAEF